MTTLLRAVLIALVLVTAVPSAGGAGAPAELVLAGVVSDGAGRPVPGAHVVLQGSRRTTTVTDHEGGFRVRAPLPSIESLRAAPCTLQVFVTARKLRMVLPRGDASLTMALAIESSPEHGERAVVRANDERVAAIAATLVAAGYGTAVADSVRFLALDGERIGDPPLAKMPHVAQVAMATTIPEPEPAPRETVQTPPGVAYHAPISPMPTGLELESRPAAPADTKTASTTAPAGSTASKPASPPPATAAGRTAATATGATAAAGAKATPSSSEPAPKTSTSSGTATKSSGKKTKSSGKNAPKVGAPVAISVHDGAAAEPHPATPPAPANGSCACRIKGTVELFMDPPPTEPVGVAIWAEDYPVIRDSVVLALGPPRPFELVGLPCGTHHLMVRSSSRHPYVIFEPRDMNLPCSAGQLLQPRIVLRPR